VTGNPPGSYGSDDGGRRVRVLAAYKDFLTLGKDADPDIPILKEAKAECAKLLSAVFEVSAWKLVVKNDVQKRTVDLQATLAIVNKA
jgi:hypothetical protein